MKREWFPQTASASHLMAGGERIYFADETARRVDRSIAYMASHLNEPLQVATLAALANVSPSHFFALFKQRTGSPPMDYFTRLRMQHAGELLFSTSASVKEVSAALGYNDPFYFSRVFKSVHRLSPSHYRLARGKVNGDEMPLCLRDTEAGDGKCLAQAAC